MTERATRTLGEVLTNPTHPGRDVHLFLPTDQPWALTTLACVIDLDDSMEEPEEVERRTGFRYALPLSTVRSVTENARLQLRNPAPEELLRAFRFYVERDAFINFAIPLN